MVRRYLVLAKNAWLVAWNLALLVLVAVVPLVAVYKGGWVAVWFMLALAFAYWLYRHPAFMVGMWISGKDRP